MPGGSSKATGLETAPSANAAPAPPCKRGHGSRVVLLQPTLCILTPRGTAAFTTPQLDGGGLQTPSSRECLLALHQGLSKKHLGKTHTGTVGSTSIWEAPGHRRDSDIRHPSPGVSLQVTARACRLSLSPAPKTPALHNQMLLSLLWLQQTFRAASGGLWMASVLPEKSKRAEPAPAARTDGISKGAHGLRFRLHQKGKKTTSADLDLTRRALKPNTTHCTNYHAEGGKGRSWMPNSSSESGEGRGFVIRER